MNCLTYEIGVVDGILKLWRLRPFPDITRSASQNPSSSQHLLTKRCGTSLPGFERDPKKIENLREIEYNQETSESALLG